MIFKKIQHLESDIFLIPCFSGIIFFRVRFFRVQIFLTPGHSGSRFFVGPGFSGPGFSSPSFSRSRFFWIHFSRFHFFRIQVFQGPCPAFRKSLLKDVMTGLSFWYCTILQWKHFYNFKKGYLCIF